MPLTPRHALVARYGLNTSGHTHPVPESYAKSHKKEACKVNKVKTTTVTRREAEKETIKEQESGRGQQRGKARESNEQRHIE